MCRTKIHSAELPKSRDHDGVQLSAHVNRVCCPAHSEESFLEPELRFEWFGDGRNVLKVYLDYSLRPPWSPYHGPDEEGELFVEFPVIPEDLRNTVASLREDLKNFPIRVACS